jgi:hypothetical protein
MSVDSLSVISNDSASTGLNLNPTDLYHHKSKPHHTHSQYLSLKDIKTMYREHKRLGDLMIQEAENEQSSSGCSSYGSEEQ